MSNENSSSPSVSGDFAFYILAGVGVGIMLYAALFEYPARGVEFGTFLFASIACLSALND